MDTDKGLSAPIRVHSWFVVSLPHSIPINRRDPGIRRHLLRRDDENCPVGAQHRLGQVVQQVFFRRFARRPFNRAGNAVYPAVDVSIRLNEDRIDSAGDGGLGNFVGLVLSPVGEPWRRDNGLSVPPRDARKTAR
jgi:hypothetical protein